MTDTPLTESFLFDALDVQIWAAHPGGLLTFVNAFTASYFGRSREQLVGEGWQNMLHSADLALAVERWTHALKTGATYHVDFRLLRASDRTYRWHHASARRVETAAGLAWIGSNVDVDSERRADEILQSWRERLAASLPGA